MRSLLFSFCAVLVAFLSPGVSHDEALALEKHAPSANAPHADHAPSPSFNEKTALEHSQSAIGRHLADRVLRDTAGNSVRLSRYRGKPLVISLIYTSCYHICPTTTRHLAKVVNTARHALGADGFHVITIGFDTANDTPEAMRVFAKQQGMDVAGWDFLSADAATLDVLAKNLGFLFFTTPKGFDHLIQATVVDAQGKIYRQVYGMNFETPLLVEPLKELVLGKQPDQTLLTGLWNKVKLFCTTYDASSDSYKFDYSLFIGMAIGIVIIGSIVIFLLREIRRNRAPRRD
jgi:protein SCO1